MTANPKLKEARDKARRDLDEYMASARQEIMALRDENEALRARIAAADDMCENAQDNDRWYDDEGLPITPFAVRAALAAPAAAPER